MAKSAPKSKLSIADKVKALVVCEIAVYGKLTKKTFPINDDLNEIRVEDGGGQGNRFTVEVYPPHEETPNEYTFAVYPIRQCITSGRINIDGDTLPRSARIA